LVVTYLFQELCGLWSRIAIRCEKENKTKQTVMDDSDELSMLFVFLLLCTYN